MIVENKKIYLNTILKNMFEIQHNLNLNICGEGYEISHKTKDGRNINWNYYIIKEATEMMDSLYLEHWKKDLEPDFKNVIVELIDVIHFILSEVISLTKNNVDIEKLMTYIFREYSIFTDSYLNIDLTDTKELVKITSDLGYKIIYSKNTLINSIMNLNLVDEIKVSTSESVYRIYGGLLGAIFLYLESVFEYTKEDIYKMYLVKNALNTVRKNNGYKAGEYIKIWDGKEDNVYAFIELIKYDFTDMNLDYNDILNIFIDKLQNKYNDVKSKVANQV